MSRNPALFSRGLSFQKNVPQACPCIHNGNRLQFTTTTSIQTREVNNKPSDGRSGHLKSRFSRRAREKLEDRQFFLDLLTSASTKREAKGYLSRFKASKTTHTTLHASGNNAPAPPDQRATSLAGYPRAVEGRPVFTQISNPDQALHEHLESLHVALVKLRASNKWNQDALDGVSNTLSQLNRLGMACCVVVDPDIPQDKSPLTRASLARDADGVASAIGRQNGPGARRIDNLLGIMEHSSGTSTGELRVLYRKLLMAPLKRGIVPVLPPVAHNLDQVAVPVSADDVMLCLVREFAGLNFMHSPDQDPAKTAAQIEKLQKAVSLDRIIIIDPAGGIPSARSDGRSHVFINLEQEFDDITQELLTTNGDNPSPQPQVNSIGLSIPKSHLRNLQLLRNTLSFLSPSSSAIITTPEEATNSARSSDDSFDAPTVGTRRQKNPLIHNLLTDKPMISSSLPLGRLGPSNGVQAMLPVSRHYPTTLAKRGIPLTIIPNPRFHPWKTENIVNSSLKSLHDPRVDLTRLVHLIEDSFSRKLDVHDYLNRVDGHLAGLIIAGEYEGGAILTWEVPPTADPSTVPPSRMVPYLDKFAVLKRSQGAGGVADILFNAMVRDCFPDGVCWRSRRDNPVNKWYFERARGSWKIPRTNWTMFWTTEGIENDRETFMDYESVCRDMKPSWVDKSVID